MKKGKRSLSVKEIRDIVDSYQGLVRMIDIAKKYSLTRQRVWQVLQVAGVDTSKKGGVLVICHYCGTEFKKPRCQVRKNRYNYCCQDCYLVELMENAIGKKPWRQGMRIGRAVVSKYYRLRQGNVVHHKDGDNHNNDSGNLMVFECSGDHLRYHRGFNVNPLWDGGDTGVNVQVNG